MREEDKLEGGRGAKRVGADPSEGMSAARDCSA